MAKNRDRLEGAQRRRRRLGLDHVHRYRYPCGLCGAKTRLTKTHVPPQCAGNTGLVFRQFFLTSTDQILRRGSRQIGGLHVYGLRQDCNGLQALYEGAYGEFAQALYPCWIRRDLAIPGGRMELPDQEIAPGAIARSVLIGVFGLNANLRNLYPQLAESLCQRSDSIELPDDIQLRLALARGTTAGVTAVSGAEVVMAGWAVSGSVAVGRGITCSTRSSPGSDDQIPDHVCPGGRATQYAAAHERLRLDPAQPTSRPGPAARAGYQRIDLDHTTTRSCQARQASRAHRIEITSGVAGTLGAMGTTGGQVPIR